MAKKQHSLQPESIDQRRPFLGLRSFEEKNKAQFGGRDHEIRKLYDLVEDHNLTVVFGTSGIGKTSLLRAGLMPKLRQKFYFPIYIRIDYSSKKTPLNQLKDHIYKAMSELDPSVIPLEEVTVWEYLHEVNLLNGLVTPVIILDQFEEIFTVGKNNKGVKEFVTELADLTQNRIPAEVKRKYVKQGKTVPSRYSRLTYRVVISLREDYLARLDELKNYIPTIMDHGFRVVQMTISQAMEAAIKPGKGLIDESVAKEIIKKLPGVSQADFDVLKEKGKDRKKLMVEPFLLSLICDRLNDQRIKKGLNTITLELVDKFKVDDIIASFYEETISEYEQNVDLAIEDLLLDAEGYRKLHALKEFQAEYNISDDIVNCLVDARIIRKESRNNVEYLELIHDVLAPVIRKKRDKRMLQEKELAKERANKLKNDKLKRWAIFIVSGVVFLGAGIGIYIWLNLKEKQNNIWEFAQQTNTEKGYRTFRKIFPNSRYDDDAIKKIDNILTLNDGEKWHAALASNTSEGFAYYLDKLGQDTLNISNSEKLKFKNYFDNVKQHKTIAMDSINNIDVRNRSEEEADNLAWENAQSGSSVKSYLAYIKNDQIVKSHLNDAISMVKKLGKTGWLFCGYSDDGINIRSSGRIIHFVWRKNGAELNSLKIPKDGDIVSPFNSRNTYRMLQELNKLIDGIWDVDQEAYVLDVIVDGKALFLKIVY